MARSPNYPRLSLVEATERIKQVYEVHRTRLQEKLSIVDALGYSGRSGASDAVVSALLKYGLLESVDDKLKVSSIAQDLIVHRIGEREYARAVETAAFTPPLFADIKADLGTRPTDHQLGVYLHKRDFTQSAVETVIAVFRDTMAFVKKATEAAQSPLEELEEDEMLDPSQTVGAFGGNSGTQDKKRTLPLPPPEDPTRKQHTLRFVLDDECDVQIVFTGRVTSEAVEVARRYLAITADTFPKKVTLVQQPLLTD